MADGFVSADIEKMEKFESESKEAVKEFDEIKNKFNDINAALLAKWKGAGADAYKTETDHILDNIGGIADILDSINNGVIKDIKDNYNKLDEELGEFNRNPPTEETAELIVFGCTGSYQTACRKGSITVPAFCYCRSCYSGSDDRILA